MRAVLIVLLWVLPAQAQGSQRPAVAVGDSWQFAVYYTVVDPNY